MSIRPPQTGPHALFFLAAFVIVVAGFREAAELIVPVMLALFLALLSLAPLRRLQRLGMPSPLAIAVVVTGATLIVLLISAVIGRSVTEFQQTLPLYQERLDAMFTDALSWLNGRGLKLDPAKLLESVDSTSIMSLVGDTASGLVVALSNLARYRRGLRPIARAEQAPAA